MIIDTERGQVRACLLIPTRGRAALMEKNLPKMQSVWNRRGTFFAIEDRERKTYRRVLKQLPKVHVVYFDNPQHSVGWALEQLRRYATHLGYDYYVMADDNCIFTRQSFANLVRATASWKRPCHMAGSHGLADFHDGKRIREELKRHGGVTSYRKMAWIFRCVPHELYSAFAYPKDLPCYADRYFSMWLMAHGYFDFRATPDAPFTKKRFVAGGIGEKHERRSTALGLARLASDFPQVFGPNEVRFPWEQMLKYNREVARARGNNRGPSKVD